MALCASLVVIIQILRRDTLRSVVDKTYASIMGGDGETFARLMTDPERRFFNLNSKDWSRFLSEYVAPELKRWTVLGGPIYEYDRPSENLFRKQMLARSDGRTIEITVSATRTEAGPRHFLTVGGLIGTLANSKYPAELSQPSALRKAYAFQNFLKQEVSVLESYGLHGVVEVSSNKLITWEELLRDTERRIPVLEQRLRESTAR